MAVETSRDTPYVLKLVVYSRSALRFGVRAVSRIMGGGAHLNKPPGGGVPGSAPQSLSQLLFLSLEREKGLTPH